MWRLTIIIYEYINDLKGMKPDMYKVLIVMLCALILLTGCVPQPKAPTKPDVDLQTDDAKASNTSPPSTSNVQQGFDVREPKDDREKFAMEFAEKLFSATNSGLSLSSDAAFAELAA